MPETWAKDAAKAKAQAQAQAQAALSGVDLHLDLSGTRVRAGLESALRGAVRDGLLRPGTRLLLSRALAADLGIARNTVAEVYSQLVAEGWLTAHEKTQRRKAMTTLTTSTGIQDHEVVNPQQWIARRKELLREEKEFTKLRDELSRQRRELPWEKVEKQYVFDGPNGKQTLADLFDGRSQLIIYHFMFGPGWEQGCPSCSYLADHFGGSLVHLANRDVTLAVVSRAPLAQIEAFQKRMGWRFRWVSSFGNDFNRDYHVSFTKRKWPAAR